MFCRLKCGSGKGCVKPRDTHKHSGTVFIKLFQPERKPHLSLSQLLQLALQFISCLAHFDHLEHFV
jgi:hypothetical protein